MVGTEQGADWTLTEHLLAVIVDKLAQANWQRQGKGSKPDPISPLAKKRRNPSKVGNADALTFEQVLARLPAHRG